jgi:3-isopropylmalate/(R)-2-methylmalate dehydratase small subunit
MMAVELSADTIDTLFDRFAGAQTKVNVDLEAQQFVFSSGTHQPLTIDFSLSEFDRTLVTSGGWVEFADSRY